MNNQLTDTRLGALLEELRMTHPEIYLNIRHTVENTSHKLIIKQMEEYFRKRPDDSHYVYLVPRPETRKALTYYFGKARFDAAQSYLVVDPTQRCIALYDLNSDGYIISHWHLFGNERVRDVLESFQGYIMQVFKDTTGDFHNICNINSRKTSDTVKEFPVTAGEDDDIDFKSMFEEDENDEEVDEND